MARYVWCGGSFSYLPAYKGPKAERVVEAGVLTPVDDVLTAVVEALERMRLRHAAGDDAEVYASNCIAAYL